MQYGDMNAEERQAQETSWPVIDGSYIVGDPAAPVAVCTLTSEDLLKPLATAPGVAIVGEVQTANQGIERIIINVTANLSIRFLLLLREGVQAVPPWTIAERTCGERWRLPAV